MWKREPLLITECIRLPRLDCELAVSDWADVDSDVR
jgi:hypothetical protein